MSIIPSKFQYNIFGVDEKLQTICCLEKCLDHLNQNINEYFIEKIQNYNDIVIIIATQELNNHHSDSLVFSDILNEAKQLMINKCIEILMESYYSELLQDPK